MYFFILGKFKTVKRSQRAEYKVLSPYLNEDRPPLCREIFVAMILFRWKHCFVFFKHFNFYMFKMKKCTVVDLHLSIDRRQK